jgi:hypothetical protein
MVGPVADGHGVAHMDFLIEWWDEILLLILRIVEWAAL